MGALSDVDPKSTGPRFILFTQADHARARALIGIEPPPADESLPLINRLPEEFDQQEALYQIAGKIDVSTASGLGELLGRGDSRKRGEAQLDWLFGRMGLEL